MPDTPLFPRDIFDRHRRAVRRGRLPTFPGYFDTLVADGLVERLGDVNRAFSHGLLIGGRSAALASALRERCAQLTIVETSRTLARRIGAICSDEDRLSVEPESADLIVWPGGLEGVNDVPGALARCRLALGPGGLLLGCVIGDGSFPTLRRCIAAADAPAAIARIHPQLSLHSLSDLMQKIGMAMIVADVEAVQLSYPSLAALVRDVRDGALGNMLAGPVRPISRGGYARAQAAFCDEASGGRVIEQVRLIHFSGWVPAASPLV
ncbi:MAG: methyltransferase domain-containing protein [Sphingopyxis sp.]